MRIPFLAAALIILATKLAAAEWPPASTPLAPGVQLISDVAFLGPGRRELLDIYLPPRAAGDATLRPAVVYFHGGGWDHGDKASERERNFGNHFASAGYVFVSANYRLGPGSWPQNVLDCKNAVRFTRANSAQYRIDPNRVVAMGTSAGGHLALLVAYTTGEKSLEPAAPFPAVTDAVRAVVDLYGITDLRTRQAVLKDGSPTGKPYDSHAPEMLAATRTANPARWELASPVTHVTADSPPTFISQGLSDATVDYVQSITLANALRAAGVPHELLLLEGVGHMYHLDASPAGPVPPQLKTALFEFLERHLGPPRADARRN